MHMLCLSNMTLSRETNICIYINIQLDDSPLSTGHVLVMFAWGFGRWQDRRSSHRRRRMGLERKRSEPKKTQPSKHLLDKRPEVGCNSKLGRRKAGKEAMKQLNFMHQEIIWNEQTPSIINRKQLNNCLINLWRSIFRVPISSKFPSWLRCLSRSSARRWSGRHRFQELGRCQGAASLHSWLGAPAVFFVYIWGCDGVGEGGGNYVNDKETVLFT